MIVAALAVQSNGAGLTSAVVVQDIATLQPWNLRLWFTVRRCGRWLLRAADPAEVVPQVGQQAAGVEEED